MEVGIIRPPHPRRQLLKMNRADRSERVRALERARDQHIAALVAREAAGGGPPPTPLWRQRFIERHCEWPKGSRRGTRRRPPYEVHLLGPYPKHQYDGQLGRAPLLRRTLSAPGPF